MRVHCCKRNRRLLVRAVNRIAIGYGVSRHSLFFIVYIRNFSYRERAERMRLCMQGKKVAIIMGSDSDFVTMKGAITTLSEFGVEYTVHVMSAHRTPEQACAFSKDARENGYGVIIAAAGKAAHLAGVLAAHTTLPVIGVPIKASTLDGLDALLSTVQMPKGVPVATVAIDGADNAAILAVQMLAIADTLLADKLVSFKLQMEKGVLAADAALQEKLLNL